MLHRNDLGTHQDSDKCLFPSPFILFTIQRLSLNKTFFFFCSLCFWLLCLNEPICWRTLPGRTWSLTRTEQTCSMFFFFFSPGKNEVIQKRTEINSCFLALATSSKLWWYSLKSWPGGKSQHLSPSKASVCRKCLKTGHNESDKREQNTKIDCICSCSSSCFYR